MRLLLNRPLALALALLASCGKAAPQSFGPANPTERTTPAPFTTRAVATLDNPWALVFLPDARMLITQKPGSLLIVSQAGAKTPVAGVPKVAYGGQGGLLDVALAPDFATSRVLYLTYSEGPDAAHSQLALARARLLTAGDRAAPQLQGVQVIWRSGSAGKGGQFGAAIAFAPDGQSLYLSSGERQRFTPAQDPDQALGKIVRLTLDGKPWPGNPMAGKTGATTVAVIDPPADTAAAASAPARQVQVDGTAPAATWSTGHRNPYGLAFDGAGRLWEVEMGPRGGDEINLIQPGRNYGWPKVSNGSNYDGLDIPDHRPGDGFEAPKLWWNPSISPGGMILYAGALWPQWKGDLFVAALSGQALIRVHLTGDRVTPGDQWDMKTRIRAIAQAPDGAIWLLEDGERGAGGTLMRLTPAR